MCSANSICRVNGYARESTPNNSRVARTFPLSMSLLGQSSIEHMRQPDACFLQLLPDNRGVHRDIGCVATLLRIG
jgi:hypothetical protein